MRRSHGEQVPIRDADNIYELCVTMRQMATESRVSAYAPRDLRSAESYCLFAAFMSHAMAHV